LQTEEEENAPKEALNGAAFAEFLSGPSGRQARAIFFVLRVPRHNSDGPEDQMDPTDQAEAPVSGIQANDAWADMEEPYRSLQERSGKGSIMTIRWREQEKERQTRASTK